MFWVQGLCWILGASLQPAVCLLNAVLPGAGTLVPMAPSGPDRPWRVRGAVCSAYMGPAAELGTTLAALHFLLDVPVFVLHV